jgi:hypothetical protein
MLIKSIKSRFEGCDSFTELLLLIAMGFNQLIHLATERKNIGPHFPAAPMTDTTGQSG